MNENFSWLETIQLSVDDIHNMELFYKRQLLQFLDSDEDESEITTEALLVEEPPTGVSLGEILGKRKFVYLLLIADACKWFNNLDRQVHKNVTNY